MAQPLQFWRDRRAGAEERFQSATVKYRDSDVSAVDATLRAGLAHQQPSHRRPSCQTRRRVLQTQPNAQNHEFIAVFAHEMRSSLGAIRNAAHFLGVQGNETDLAQNARRLIERQVGRMTQLADDLVNGARVGNQAQQLRFARIDLRAVLEHALETVESQIVAHGHRLATGLPATPVWIYADAGQLEQVFVNLLVNAAKYTDRGGNLSLAVQLGDAHVSVRICDSGIGIAADDLPRVFNLFMQVDATSRRAAAGLGIGLALVRSLVDLHGGSVSATSAGLGHGSQFTVRLPAL